MRTLRLSKWLSPCAFHKAKLSGFAVPYVQVNVMSEADKVFAGSIPSLYDRYLGPFLFKPYALDLARRLAGLEGRLLETAAGTGVLTRALVDTLPPSIAITATDLNQPMLDHAAQGLAALDVPVEWHVSAGIGHGIDQEGLRQGGEFLARRFARSK